MIKGIHVILASASPRRRELLGHLGWSFDVRPSDADEVKIAGEEPSAMVMRLSRLKGEVAAAHNPDALVISSDTVVALDGAVFGKPADGEDALRMLRVLAGRSHYVYTGLALFLRGICLCEYDRTKVTFRELSEDALRCYVATGEPIGKAGAYAIQGPGGLMVSSIDGDYSTVVGLPLGLLGRMMEKLGFTLSDMWEVRQL